MKLICDEKGCDFSCSGPYAKQEMGRHRRFTHGISGKSQSAVYDKARKAAMGNSPSPSVEAPPKPKKQKLQAMANYCPECGCNLRAVNAAINLGRH